MRNLFLVSIYCLGLAVVSCANDEVPTAPPNAIVVGALLPFSGEQAAVGINMEQAVTLAVDDVNQAGGVLGRPLYLASRDSNSGSQQGYEQGRELLYDMKLPYLIGPEENSLAKKLVTDVKKLDILNILPGIAAPVIRETGAQGGWLRLAPSPREVGCAMALHAVAAGYKTAASIVSSDDYQTQLASEFNTFFTYYGGRSLGTMTVNPEGGTYGNQVRAIQGLKADLSLMLAYPTTASEIMEEWAVIGNATDWFFSSTLHTRMFLQNSPLNRQSANLVFSPSQRLNSECELEKAISIAGGSEGNTELIQYANCQDDNAETFAAHFSEYWTSDPPLPASLYYYDAVVLLALGLTAAAVDGHPNPTPTELRKYIRQISEYPGEPVSWSNIADGFARIKNGEDIFYVGAAAQYQFDGEDGKPSYGLAQHRSIDVWGIDRLEFVHDATIGVTCSVF